MSRIVEEDKGIITEKKNCLCIDKLSAYINSHRKLRFFIDVIVVLVYIAFIVVSIGFWLEGNDDNTFAYIVSGRISEEPLPYLYFSNIVWGVIVSSLYRIIPEVAWYGVIQIVLIFMMLLFSLHSIEQRCKSIISYCGVMMISIVTMFLAIKMIAFVQFTTLSALLAIAGYICLIMYEKRSHKLVGFLFFEVFSFLIREESMLMIQPLGYTCFIAITVMGLFIETDKSVLKTKIKGVVIQSVSVLSIVLTIAGLLKGVDKLAYATDSWRNTMVVNEFRTRLNDFYYAPEYEEVETILAKYDIDRYEYEAMKSTRMIDIDEYVEPAQEIVEYLVDKNAKNRQRISMSEMLAWIFSNSYVKHWETIVLTLLAIMVLLFSDKPLAALTFLMYMVGKIFTFGYIFYLQRIVDRVMQPLYYSEIIFLLCIIFATFISLYNKQTVYRKYIYMGSLAILASYSLFATRDVKNLFIHSREQTELYRVWNKVSTEVADYCGTRSDDRFLISGEIVMYWKYPLMSTGYSDKGNYTFLGGWFCTSPMAQDFICEITDTENCYLILTTDNQYDEANIDILKYCEETFGVTPEFDEVINTSIGEYAAVYKIK